MAELDDAVTTGLLNDALIFYEGSPDGQYDHDVVVPILRREVQRRAKDATQVGTRYCIVNVDPQRGVIGWVIGDSFDYLKSRASGTHIPAALDNLKLSPYRGIYDLGEGYTLLVED